MTRKCAAAYSESAYVGSAGEQKRRHLYGRFSDNLRRVKAHPKVNVSPDVCEGYICPTCLKLFDRDALPTGTGDCLALEHVPPETLGGQVATLTCRSCNNQAGSRVESHLARKLRADAVLAGEPNLEIDIRFRPDKQADLAATMWHTQDGAIEIVYDTDRSDPLEVAELRRLEASGGPSLINVEVRLGYRRVRSQTALLRIAYLLAFAQFGYGFLLNPNLYQVRDQIQDPDSRVLPDCGVMGAQFPDFVKGVNIIVEPEHLRSFVVVFDLHAAWGSSRQGVLLPGPDADCLAIYDWIAEYRLRRADTTVNHRIQLIPEADYLGQPGLEFAAHHFWYEGLA